MIAALVIAGAAHAGDWGKASDDWGKSASVGPAAGSRLSVQEPIVVGDLALYPVVDREASGRPEVDVRTLGPAMSAGAVQVREDADGSVDQLVVVNRSDEAVLVMAGDVVHGGMQDRVIQQTELVAGGRAVRVPVRCVERGRWTGSGGFVYAGRVNPQLRSVVRTGSQEDTWSAVAANNRSRGVSPSASWLAGRHLDPVELAAAERQLEAKFADDKRVVGVVVARNGAFTGAEVYPLPALFAQDRLEVLSGQLSARPAAARSDAIAHGSVPSRVDAAAYLARAGLDTALADAD